VYGSIQPHVGFDSWIISVFLTNLDVLNSWRRQNWRNNRWKWLWKWSKNGVVNCCASGSHQEEKYLKRETQTKMKKKHC